MTDWAQGGRTTQADADRVFFTEAERGPGRVAAVLRSGTRGVAFCPALNRCAEYPPVPEYEDTRRKTCIWGEVHASLLQLIRGEFQAALEDEVVVEMAAAEELEAKRRTAETKRLVRAPSAHRALPKALWCVECGCVCCAGVRSQSAPAGGAG